MRAVQPRHPAGAEVSGSAPCVAWDQWGDTRLRQRQQKLSKLFVPLDMRRIVHAVHRFMPVVEIYVVAIILPRVPRKRASSASGRSCRGTGGRGLSGQHPRWPANKLQSLNARALAASAPRELTARLRIGVPNTTSAQARRKPPSPKIASHLAVHASTGSQLASCDRAQAAQSERCIKRGVHASTEVN